jgi:hypothetical protein
MTVGFMVKAALFPVHIWLPDAHAIAPSPISAVLSGLVVKIGIIGMLRVYQIFNAAGRARPHASQPGARVARRDLDRHGRPSSPSSRTTSSSCSPTRRSPTSATSCMAWGSPTPTR